MPNDSEKKERKWLVRFATSAMVAVIAATCAYFGLWQATMKWGVSDLAKHLADEEVNVESGDISVPVPLVIKAGTWQADPISGSFNSKTWTENYYFWLFGYVVKAGG